MDFDHEVDLSPFDADARAALAAALTCMGGLTGAEGIETVSTAYLRLCGLIAALPDDHGTASEHVDRARLLAFRQGLAVGLTTLAAYAPAEGY